MSVEFVRETDRIGRINIDFDSPNLLTSTALQDLEAAMTDIPRKVSVIVVAAGKPANTRGLSAGIDLEQAKDFSVIEGRKFIGELRDSIEAVRNCDAVTVCACGDYALGGAFEIALACDFRIATRTATLGLPEVNVGLITGIHGGLLIPLVGLQKAKELIYTGKTISGTQAADIGLINKAVSESMYEEAVDGLVDDLADKSPVVMRLQKEAFRAWRNTGVDRGIEHTRELIAACFALDDQLEGMNAFLDGRDPEFVGK